ncbi:MAG: hypothetical protein H6Q81_680, partial [Deltaproteobacteria bacterium]|nr:hypothetical protein [Deltaproteobacteria bacterium]
MTDEAKKAIPPESEEPDEEVPGAEVPATGSRVEEKEGGPEIPAVLPLLPVRDIVIFPYMTLPLFV